MPELGGPSGRGSGEDGDDQLVEAYLRFLRGRGPRPRTDDRPETEELLALLDAIADAHDVRDPPVDVDPVAIRLGLVEAGPDAVTVSLHELAHRFGGDLDISDLEPGDDVRPGWPRPRAVCRTLGEVVLVAEVDDGLDSSPRRVASLFAEHPATSAVAVVSTSSLLAVVLTEADCVVALDPVAGRVGPALPHEPEPFGLALGRHLERSLPRWDEIARLDEMLVLAHDARDIVESAERALREGLGRAVRIPARREAQASLRALPADAVVAVVEDVRTGELRGDELIRRIRVLSEMGAA
jgi:hypothetical protein